jgi:acetolactate synthase-1/2/3 large subunit
VNRSTVALQLLDVLRDFGVNTVFGIPGGTVSALYAALLSRPDVKIVTAKHETGAMFMALGYAVATGRPGVVLTIAGPGITNALTGLASAFYEGAPVIHIAGEVPRTSFGRNALQEGSSSTIDAVALARPMTKFSAQITRAGSAAAVLRKALNTAYSGRRGPVFLSLPLDVANEPAPDQPLFGTVRSSFEINAQACHEAVETLAAAERPLILAGSGSRDSTSRRSVRRLAEYIGSPVAVTTKAKGVFPEDHPLYLGIFGFGGHDSVTDYLADGIDVLLVCGSGLGDIATNAWSPMLKAKKKFIQIDIDAAQLGRNYPIDIGLLGPVDAVVGRMLEHRSERIQHHQVSWDGPRYQPIGRSSTGALTAAEVMITLNRVCPPTSVFTTDIGEHLAPALHYLRVREGGDYLGCIGFSSMGSGICSAIGYNFGTGTRRVFAICGDGGFLMYGSELATAVQHRVPTTFVIFNDSRLNMVHHGMRDVYGVTPDFSTQTVDFVGLAKSVGADGYLVRTTDELAAAIQAPVDGPLVLDVRFDPDARLTASQRNAALRQFKDSTNAC